MEILKDKAKKALHPLMGAIAKFDLPVKLSIRRFRTYITPILLYSVENWAILSNLDIQRFDNLSLFKKDRQGVSGHRTQKTTKICIRGFKDLQ